MKLLLTSCGFTNRTISNALLELANKPFKDLNLVFIPTSANIETSGKEWLIQDLYNCKKLRFNSIRITDIAAVTKDTWLPQLEKADIITFGGGNAFYLMEQIKKSGLDKILPELLKTRIYVGISAGSMVAGRGLPLAFDAILYYKNIGRLKEHGALNFVNLNIRPHFNSPDFPMVTEKILEEMARKIEEPVYALDDDSAVKVDGSKIGVASEGQWKRFN